MYWWTCRSTGALFAYCGYGRCKDCMTLFIASFDEEYSFPQIDAAASHQVSTGFPQIDAAALQ